MNSSSARDYVQEELVNGLSTVADLCADSGYWDAGEHERLQVGAWQLHQALICPRRTAATPPTPFESTVGTVSRAAALDAFRQLAHGAAGPPSAFVEAYRDGDAERWPWNWIRHDATKRERSLVAQRATTFVSRCARSVSGWPIPSLKRVGWRPAWEYPGRALRLAGRVDLLYVDEPSLAIAFNGSWNGFIRSELAFQVVMAVLGFEEPRRAVAMFPDVGRHADVEFAVDERLLDDGIRATCEAAQSVAAQRSFTDRTQVARPGTQCRHCPINENCEEGLEWLAEPGRRRFGFPT
jgi:hypothetical protein